MQQLFIFLFFNSTINFYFSSNEIDLKERVPFALLNKFMSIVDIMNSQFDLNIIQKDIQESKSLYLEIEKMYKEVKTKLSNFPLYVDSFLSQVKEFNNNYKIPEEYTLNKKLFLKLKRHNNYESISFSLSNEEKDTNLKVILPTFERVFELYNSRFKGYTFLKEGFNIIFSEEIFKINKFLFDNFFIKDNETYFNVSFLDSNIDHGNFKYFDLHTNSSISMNHYYFNKIKLEVIHQRNTLNNQLSNF